MRYLMAGYLPRSLPIIAACSVLLAAGAVEAAGKAPKHLAKEGGGAGDQQQAAGRKDCRETQSVAHQLPTRSCRICHLPSRLPITSTLLLDVLRDADL